MDKKKYFKMNEYQFNVYYTMVTSSTDNVYNKCTQFGSWTFHSHYIDQQQKKTGHQLGRRQLLRINTTYKKLNVRKIIEL